MAFPCVMAWRLNIVDERQPLRVMLNRNRKYNYHFYDELTNTILSLSNPVSEDLNAPLINRRTGQKVYNDLSGIRKGLDNGIISIIEGELDNYTKFAPRINPIIRSITPSIRREWNEFVQSKTISNATDTHNGSAHTPN